jgi:hypothetical protein
MPIHKTTTSCILIPSPLFTTSLLFVQPYPNREATPHQFSPDHLTGLRGCGSGRHQAIAVIADAGLLKKFQDIQLLLPYGGCGRENRLLQMAHLQSLPGLAPETNAFSGLQLASLRMALLCCCAGALPSKGLAVPAPKALLQEQQAFV